MNIYYEEAISEIKRLVKANPFQINFKIFQGCISEEITKYISSEMKKNGIKNKVKESGFLIKSWYLDVTIILPTHLIHKKEKTMSPRFNYIENYIPPGNKLCIGPTIDDQWEN